MNAQLHVALLALTENERFDIVVGAAPSGPEASRRLIRRWDPLSGRERSALWRQTMVPDRCKVQELAEGLEKWEDQVRRYERGKASGSEIATALDDGIRTAKSPRPKRVCFLTARPSEKQLQVFGKAGSSDSGEVQCTRHHRVGQAGNRTQCCIWTRPASFLVHRSAWDCR